ncbi:NAD(P)/FAD-dependent oxidoreductase [Pyxidicoccus sp. MSG2]|uniref:NAD(P)/FAD-dependent oxidoreductase n=1 Tax=Pyxidicoccus sp. MSG2 TaxID=2996790 RepID=UPI00227194EE|nr:FAD-dependent oxidoreductase [Pyxidicoccus sp. MSG2]MCY1021704.1 FAD-dependent oxidoreductase [Pyxidicoccus sp. MSG2]
MSRSFDVIVVGNGVLANATARALTLQEPGIRVAIVGPAARPRAATVAAGAMLGCFGEITTTLLKTEIGRTKVDLAYRATRLWPEWVEGLNAGLAKEDHVTIRNGTYVINNNMSGTIEDANYDAIRRTLAKYEEPFEEIDPGKVPGLDPADDCRPLRALFIPGEGTVDSGALLNAYTASARRSERITLVDDSVVSLRLEGSKLAGVVTASGETLSADKVLLAAGVDTQTVLDQHPDLARRIPRVFPGGGCSIVLESEVAAPAGVIRTPNRAFACGLHAVHRGDKRVYVGATNHVVPRPFEKPVANNVLFLLECALDQLNRAYAYHSAQIVTMNAGNRPVPIDGCPIVGDTSIPGLWILTGTYRDGLHLSPLLAQDLARRMFGKPAQHEVLFKLFKPERRPLALRTREEAVEDAVLHYAAVGYEHGMNIPRVGWHRTFSRMYRNVANSIYDALESDHIMPPEFLPMIDNDREKWVPFFRNYLRELTRA